MMRRLIALAIGCAVATAARAEIGTNMTERYGVQIPRLFWVTDGQVIGADCERGTEVFVHALCHENAKSVAETALFDAMTAIYGGELPDVERRLGQIELALSQIDARMLEELSIEATPANEALRLEMERAAASVRAKDGEVLQTEDQIERIKDELARAEDAELRAQLRVYEQRRAKAAQERVALDTDARAARARYVDAGVANGDGETWDGLVREHRRLTDRRSSLVNEVNTALKDVIAVRKLFQKLHESMAYAYILGRGTFLDTHYIVVGPSGGRSDFPDGFNHVFLRVHRGEG